MANAIGWMNYIVNELEEVEQEESRISVAWRGIEWRQELMRRAPQQYNSIDCGVFMMLCMRYDWEEIPCGEWFAQNDISQWREAIGVEILRNTLVERRGGGGGN